MKTSQITTMFSVSTAAALATSCYALACPLLPSAYCPPSPRDSLALLLLCAALLLSKTLPANSEQSLSATSSSSRRLAVVLLWLLSGGSFAFVFGSMVAEASGEIAGIALRRRVGGGRWTRRAAELGVYACVFGVHGWGLVGFVFARSVMGEEENGEEEERGRMSWVVRMAGPLIVTMVICAASSVRSAVMVLAWCDLFVDVEGEGEEEEEGDGVFGKVPLGAAAMRPKYQLALPRHGAGAVVAAYAVSMAGYPGMSVVSVAIRAFSASVVEVYTGESAAIPSTAASPPIKDEYDLIIMCIGLIASLYLTADACGSIIVAPRVHVWMDRSLLRTGLVFFWCLALFALPAALVLSEPGHELTRPFEFTAQLILFSLSCVLWVGASSAARRVVNKLVSEWTVLGGGYSNFAGPEQRWTSAAAKAVSALLCAYAATERGIDLFVVQVAVSVSVICSFLAALLYTFWYARNDIFGAFRVVDGEGRELLRISG